MSEEIKITKSAAKREARRKEIKSAKSKAALEKIIGTTIGIVIAAVFILIIALGIWRKVDVTVSGNNFGYGLNEDGTIIGAKLDKATVIDFKSIKVPAMDIEFTDAEVDDSVNSTLEGYATFDTETDKAIENGDTINLDYTGKLDGVPFENGSSEGNGYELEIGSGSFVGNFEEQMIGHKIGDEFTIEVTFPDEYENNPDLAGKLTTFDIVINSIKVVPELTDEFVAENLYEEADTAEGYRAHIKEEGRDHKLEDYILDYVDKNAKASSIPSGYIKNLRSLQKYQDEQMYETYNSYYTYLMGYTPYSKLSDYTGKEGYDYEVALKESAKKAAALNLTYEASFKAAGLTIEDADYDKALEVYGDEETYGKAFLMQMAMREKLLDYAKTVVTIE